MPMPHTIQRQKIAERLKCLEGKTKVREIRKILQEISQYKSGPYGEMRAWLMNEIGKTQVKRKIKAREGFAVKRQGDFQIGFLGQPSAGKTTLINALSGANMKTASYAFTTLKPQAATIQIFGVDFQLVDLPGIIERASEGKGLGKRILATTKSMDGFVFVADASRPVEELKKIVEEVRAFDAKLLEKPAIIVANKCDLAEAQQRVETIEKFFPEKTIISISAIQGKGMEKVREKIWVMSGLIKAYSYGKPKKPLALYPPATVKDFAEKIHKELVEQFAFAHVWGASAKFPGQKVGLAHELKDNDIVEIIAKTA